MFFKKNIKQEKEKMIDNLHKINKLFEKFQYRLHGKEAISLKLDNNTKIIYDGLYTHVKLKETKDHFIFHIELTGKSDYFNSLLYVKEGIRDENQIEDILSQIDEEGNLKKEAKDSYEDKIIAFNEIHQNSKYSERNLKKMELSDKMIELINEISENQKNPIEEKEQEYKKKEEGQERKNKVKKFLKPFKF